jgi:hypothetical protein
VSATFYTLVPCCDLPPNYLNVGLEVHIRSLLCVSGALGFFFNQLVPLIALLFCFF